jgi:uncharacterized protein with HEPN domain
VRDQGVYLEHILECIERVQRYTTDGLESLLDDQKTQDAVLRNLQVLSESCMRMSSEIRDRRKEIDWKGIARFRNVVVHDYFEIDLEEIWEIIQRDLPPLATVIGEELARVDADLRDKAEGGST